MTAACLQVDDPPPHRDQKEQNRPEEFAPVLPVHCGMILRVLQEATGEKPRTPAVPPPPEPGAGKNPAAVALGRLGGLKGGEGAGSEAEQGRAEGGSQEGGPETLGRR